MWKLIQQDAQWVLQKIETGEQIVVQFLTTEAEKLGAFLAGVGAAIAPEAKSALIGLVAAGEQALAALATAAGGALGPVEAAAVTEVETVIGNYVAAKFPGAVAGELVTIADHEIVVLGETFVSIVQAALAKFIAALSLAAKPAPGAAA